MSRGGTGRTIRGGRGIRPAYIVVGVILVAILGAFIAVVVATQGQQAAAGAPEGTETFDITDRTHTQGEVDYEQTPPAGGPHHPVWQNCGFYSEPVVDEHAVHSLEHGAVWITYSPDLPQEQVDTLRNIATGQTYILVSPYEGLPSPVVASAWNHQIQLDSADDPRLQEFIEAFRLGPQTPEPGAPCTNGIGEPEA
ncbi:DUF3105 domain-containing protein [Rubrobacter taiwanensis]|uniref:DUF3105 domain-containing protein n=1 Tax=Rubrobacter taiwanensis TaxID=185139 RepID=UPI001A9D413E|nr:DUF3105 domain-containing protein [Rubrobacter taiwanensis]